MHSMGLLLGKRKALCVDSQTTLHVQNHCMTSWRYIHLLSRVWFRISLQVRSQRWVLLNGSSKLTPDACVMHNKPQVFSALPDHNVNTYTQAPGWHVTQKRCSFWGCPFFNSVACSVNKHKPNRSLKTRPSLWNVLIFPFPVIQIVRHRKTLK